MSEADVLFTLSVIAIVAFGVTRVSPHFGYSKRAVLIVAALVISGSIVLLLSSLSHPPMVEASGILHD
jgi:hypothetical protein